MKNRHAFFVFLIAAASTLGFMSCSNPANNPGGGTTNHTITFDANGGSGTMTSQTIAEGATAKLKSSSFTRSGYSFAGWSTTLEGAVAYVDGASYAMGSSDLTLFAVWTASSSSATVLNTNITTDTSLPPNTSYRVTIGNLHIANGATLTIGAGVTIFFNTDCELTLDATSRLVTNGTSESPIIFTSSASSPKKGDWDGITVNSNDANFIYCVIEYAGMSSYNTLNLGGGSSTTISHCTIAHNAYDAIDASALASGSINATITDTAIYDNSGIPLIVTDGVDFETGNSFSSGILANTKQYVQFNGAISSPRSFGITSVPYVFPNSNTHIKSGAVLTVASGVTMKFGTDCELTVDSGGALNATGTTFTSALASPAKGDWDGISVNGHASLSGCTVEYAGMSSYNPLNLGGSSSSTISHCTIARNAYDAIDASALASGSINATITDTAIYDNSGIPLLVTDGVDFETGNSFSSGILANTKQYVQFSGNIYSLRSFGITSVPYVFPNSNTHIRSGAVLTVASGVTMKFGTDRELTVDSGGALDATGATFTSALASPSRGDWNGIVVNGHVSLDNSFIEYAGYGSYWGLWIDGGSAVATLTNTSFLHLKYGGLRVASGATATISGCAIQTSYSQTNSGNGDFNQAYGFAYDASAIFPISPGYTWDSVQLLRSTPGR